MAAGASRGTLERSESLDVMSVGEEVEQVERSEAPTRRGQPCRVARKRYRIAGEEANDVAGLLGNGVDHIASRSRARRIEKDEIRCWDSILLDRRVDELHIRGHVPFRIFE